MTHFLLATLIACALDARLSLLVAIEQGVIIVADAAGTALDSASLPLINRAMTMDAHRTSRAHGRGRRGGTAADDAVAIHTLNGAKDGQSKAAQLSGLYRIGQDRPRSWVW